MLKKYITLTLALLVLNMPLATIAYAQAKDDKDSQRERDVQIFVNRFGTNNHLPVKVNLKNDKKTVGGHISQINDDNFVVTNRRKNTSTTIAYRDVKEISRDTGHKILITSLVVIGVIIGGTLICVASGHCVD